MSETYSAIPTEVVSYTGATTDRQNALTGITSDTAATTTTGISTSSTSGGPIDEVQFTIGFDLSSIPANAVIDSLDVYAKASKEVSSTGSCKTRSTRCYFYIHPSRSGTSPTYCTVSYIGFENLEPTVIPLPCSNNAAGVVLGDIGNYIRLRCRVYTSGTSNGGNITVSTIMKLYGAEINLTYTTPSGAKVKTKINGEWLDGDVKVKANGEWVDADALFVKVDGAWEQLT